jgi:zinc/manganese transport system permease protein
MSLIELLWPAFVLAIALVFIHAVFGIEIIRRGVIFTDLAIGQIAAVGMAISIAFMHSQYQSALTLLFAVIAAGTITWGTRNVRHVEAFIGLLYALGISSIMLILSRSAEGLELFNKLSAADILFVTPDEVIKSVLLYSFVGFIMFFVYPRLRGIVKELLFFVMLAITVTSSVQSAGVLVVFSLLIAPAYAAIVQSKFHQLLFAWIFGSTGIITALFSSYYFDLPTGYTIIFIMVFASIFFIVAKTIIYKSKVP